VKRSVMADHPTAAATPAQAATPPSSRRDALPDAAVQACAARLVEMVPPTMRFLRAQMQERTPGMSMAQFRALVFLYRRKGVSLTELAEHLGVTLPTASAIVERMVRRGLVARAVDETSRRRLSLRLTARGAARHEAAREHARRRTAVVLASLTPAKIAALRRGLDVLAETLAHERINR
jgi:DNA-binding MarR family transcriptional regulator